LAFSGSHACIFLPEFFLPGIFLPGIRSGKYRYEIFLPEIFLPGIRSGEYRYEIFLHEIFSKSQDLQVVCMLLLLLLLHVRACLDEPACMNLHACCCCCVHAWMTRHA
jgi:hypothetical protein